MILQQGFQTMSVPCQLRRLHRSLSPTRLNKSLGSNLLHQEMQTTFAVTFIFFSHLLPPFAKKHPRNHSRPRVSSASRSCGQSACTWSKNQRSKWGSSCSISKKARRPSCQLQTSDHFLANASATEGKTLAFESSLSAQQMWIGPAIQIVTID